MHAASDWIAAEGAGPGSPRAAAEAGPGSLETPESAVSGRPGSRELGISLLMMLLVHD